MTTLKLDATGAAFFSRQLEKIKAKTYDVKYPGLSYTKVFPISNEAPPGTQTITYRTYDHVGKAQILNGYAKDLSRADVAATETSIPVRPIGSSFGYTVFEIQSAQVAGVPLDQKRANAAREAIERQLNTIAFTGDSASNLTGLFSDANIPRGNAPDGAALTPEWSTKTAAEILTDVNRGFTEVFEDSLGVHRANKMLLPISQWNLLMTTPIGTDYNHTVAKYVVANSPFLTSLDDIVYCNELDEAGAAGVDPAVFMSMDPEMLEFEMVQDVTFLEEEKRGIEYVTPVIAQTAGLNVYYPWSLFILEKI